MEKSNVMFIQITNFKKNDVNKERIGITLKSRNSGTTWYPFISNALNIQFYIMNNILYLQMCEIGEKAFVVGIDNTQIEMSNSLQTAYTLWKKSCINDLLPLDNFQEVVQEEMQQRIKEVADGSEYNKAIKQIKKIIPTSQYHAQSSTHYRSILKRHIQD